MSVQMSVSKRFDSLMHEHHDYLVSHDNVFGGVTLNTATTNMSVAGRPKEGVLYPVGQILHTVLTRRSYKRRSRSGGRARGWSRRDDDCPTVALHLATYSAQIGRSGRIGLGRLHHVYDLREGINHGDAGRKPKAVPSNRPWLLGAACDLVEAVIAARDSRAPDVYSSIDTTDFFVPIHSDPGRIVVDSVESRTLATAVASGRLSCGLPSEFSPIDGMIFDVMTPELDAVEGVGYAIVIVPVKDGFVPVPGQPIPDDAVTVELPASAILEPTVRAGSFVQKGARLAVSVIRQRYSKWASVTKALRSESNCCWYQQQAVRAVDGSEFPQMRRADFQDPALNRNLPVFEAVRPDRPLVSLASCSYNRNDPFVRKTPAVEIDLWSLTTGERPTHGSDHDSARTRADT